MKRSLINWLVWLTAVLLAASCLALFDSAPSTKGTGASRTGELTILEMD